MLVSLIPIRIRTMDVSLPPTVAVASTFGRARNPADSLFKSPRPSVRPSVRLYAHTTRKTIKYDTGIFYKNIARRFSIYLNFVCTNYTLF